jgi:archaellum component FlaC
MKQSMEDMFGVDLGDTSDVTSPEELLAKIHAQMAQEASQAEASPPPKRKKTAKQLAREAEKKAEDDQTSLSIREVYRKLVSALHPDREPDPDERQRKTALMQRVNQAYDKKDLLQLLELQLELEHIDAHSIAGMSEDRIKHFNKILKEQLAELDQEIEYVEMPLRAQFNAYSFQTLTPASVIPQLNSDIADLKRQVKEIKQDLNMLKDLPSLKAWIKAYRRQVKAMQRDQDDDLFF